MVLGALKRAISKRSRTSFSESPRHLDAKVDEVSEKNEVSDSVGTNHQNGLRFAGFEKLFQAWLRFSQGHTDRIPLT